MIRPRAAALALIVAAPSLAWAQEPGMASPPPTAGPASPEPAPAEPAPPPASPASPEPVAVPSLPQHAASPPSAEPAGPLATVRLRDGQLLRGRIVSRDESRIVIDSGHGVRYIVPTATVAELLVAAPDAAEAPWESDPNRTRYLYSPSAFMLRAGEGYVSQTELLLTTVAWGATDWLTLGVGGVIPIWFFGGDALHLIALAKVGGQVTPGLHAAATVQSLLAPGLDATTLGLAFGTITVGRPDLHLGISAGVPFVVGDEDDPPAAAFSVSGVARTSPRIALVGELWSLPGAKNLHTVGGFAIRFIGSGLSVDAGFAMGTGSNAPLPWLDFTWNY